MAIEGPVPDRLRMVRSRSHPDERIQRIEDALGARIIVSGSVGTKCALISEGMADVYVHPVPFLKEWDTCAPEALLRGAGGRVTDCCGDPLSYGKKRPVQPLGIFAARAEIVDAVAPTVLAIGAEMSGQAEV